MRIPIKLNHETSEIIIGICTKQEKGYRHMLHDRIDRIENVAGHKFGSISEVQIFLKEFLVNSEVYFSTTRLNSRSNIPERINESISNEIIAVISELVSESKLQQEKLGFQLPLSVLGNKKTPRIIKSLVYMYCIKGNGVLILAMNFSGDIIPRLDDWVLNFAFGAITFMDFESEAHYIPPAIASNVILKRINTSISVMFLSFINQASIIAEHYEGVESDERALNSLLPEQKEILNIYLPMFNRYGDIDQRIKSIIDTIEAYWTEQKLSDCEWIIFSYSYCLPYWFEMFYKLLAEEDKRYLQTINPNMISIENIERIIILLEEFKRVLKVEGA